MKEPYIVYYHHVKLSNTVVHAYSPAQAEYIVSERLRKKGYKDYGIDGVMTVRQENKMNATRFNL